MESEVLNYIKEKNQFPIIFIGAGMPKRYLENYPSWIELLEELWLINNNGGDFYSYLLRIRREIEKSFYDKGITINEETLNHKVNTYVAMKIEEEINEAFVEGKIEIDGLSTKDVYYKKISPFKKIISDRFSEMKLKEEKKDEYEQFKKMICNAQSILTTNYDEFIEKSFESITKNKLTKFVGEQGLFHSSTGYAELYKIHGCFSDVNSIVITEQDYEKFNKSSVLISAKIISLMLYSPIVFLGYSLTDVNIRTIIRNFAKSLTGDELNILEKNLIIIERKEGEEKIVESIENDTQLGCRYRVIKTDNFYEVFKIIGEIKQGATPFEVQKYLHLFKEIIINKGEAGELDTVLINRGELDTLIKKGIRDRKLVVAIGDKQFVYVMPSLATYMRDYIKDEYKQDINNQLRFIVTQQGRLPLIKYVNEENINACNLSVDEKESLRRKIRKYGSIDEIIDGLKMTFPKSDSIKKILEQGKEYKQYYIYMWIIYNSKNIPLDELKEFLLDKIEECIDKNIKPDSNLRKLSVIYDIRKYNV